MISRQKACGIYYSSFNGLIFYDVSDRINLHSKRVDDAVTKSAY